MPIYNNSGLDLVYEGRGCDGVWCGRQVARRGSTQCGMPAPTLVHFEQQIDAELLQADVGAVAADCRGVADGQEDGSQLEVTATSDGLRKPAVEVDWMSLDEMVRGVVVCLTYDLHRVTDTIRATWKMFTVLCGKFVRDTKHRSLSE